MQVHILKNMYYIIVNLRGACSVTLGETNTFSPTDNPYLLETIKWLRTEFLLQSTSYTEVGSSFGIKVP